MADPNFVLISEVPMCAMLVCKAGSTSIKEAMLNTWPDYRIDQSPNRSFEYGGALVTKDDAMCHDEWLKFSVVRNPYDRLESCWRDKGPKGMVNKWPFDPGVSWSAFVNGVCNISDDNANQHFRSMTYDLMEDRLLIPDYVFKLEEIDKGWKALQNILSYRDVSLADLNVYNNRRVNSAVHWTPLQRASVRARYAMDFEVLDYD